MKLSEFFAEFWILPGLIVTLIISLVLCGLHLAKWHGSEHFAQVVLTNNTTMIILIQIISHTLGMVLVQSLCALLKIHYRSATVHRSVTFEYARFLNALAAPRPLWSAKKSYVAATVIFAILSAGPGAIWSGALAVRVTTDTFPTTIAIPRYPTNNLSAIFDVQDIQNANGDFSCDPTRYTSRLVTSAQDASGRNTSQPDQTPHAKLDNTGFTYLTRSYGTASSVGLSQVSRGDKPLTYVFNETGIAADVQCVYNNTATFAVQWNGSSTTPSGWRGTTAYTIGRFPNGASVDSYWLYGPLFQDLLGLDVLYVNRSRSGIVVFATGGNLWQQGQFGKMQCQAQFKSHTIRINVNEGQKSIKTEKLEEIPWPVYGDKIVNQAFAALRRLSDTDNGFAGSRVGRALWTNARKLRYLETGNYSSDSIPGDIILRSTSDFVVSVFENSLVGIGACRHEGARTTENATAIVELRSVVWGTAEFIYTILGMNIALVSATIYIVVVKQVWRDTVQLDFGDVADVALNASKGGAGLFQQVRSDRSLPDARFMLQDVRSRWPGIVVAEDPVEFQVQIVKQERSFDRTRQGEDWLLHRE